MHVCVGFVSIYIHYVYTHIFIYKIISLIVTKKLQGVDDFCKLQGAISPSLAN